MEPLPASALQWRCDPDQLEFETTAQFQELDCVFGQRRAVEAVRFGIEIRREGYNIFALGPQGTGKHSVVERCLQECSPGQPTPADWCYVNNFEDLRKPLAIALPAGSGARLRDDVAELIEDLTNAIPAALESEEHRARLADFEHEEDAVQDTAYQALADKAETQKIQMLRTPGGFVLAPAPEGKVRAAHWRRDAAAAGGGSGTPSGAVRIPDLLRQHLPNRFRNKGGCRASWLERKLVARQNIRRAPGKEDVGESCDRSGR